MRSRSSSGDTCATDLATCLRELVTSGKEVTLTSIRGGRWLLTVATFGGTPCKVQSLVSYEGPDAGRLIRAAHAGAPGGKVP